MKCLLVLYSYHHRNTEKVAQVMAEVLNSHINTPKEIQPEELNEFNLIGFGSGIYSAKHHKHLLELADSLPKVLDKKVFIFSTAALTGKKKMAQDHLTLREILQSKDYMIVDEFQCKGFNTNSFMKYFGGMNKGRPNTQDLKKAKEFAQNIKENLL
jgi:flavodoxin